jgi:predicted neuraminidase
MLAGLRYIGLNMAALLSGSFALLGQQGQYQIPPVDSSKVLKAELIYPLENRPTPECHASTIVQVDDGLLAAWFGGTHEKNDDVGIWTSRNFNGVWSYPTEVVNGVQNDSVRYPCWNPVLFQPDSGPLMLFYKVGPSPSEWWGMVMSSSDQGQTWSEPQKLGKSQHGDLLGPIKNQPIQLEDGTIISPTSIEYEDDQNNDFWRVYFEISKDKGKTWKATDFINDGVEFDAIQPSILIHPNNALQILCRTRQNVISQSWSYDNGKTWSPMTATSLPNPSAGTDAVTLKDGRHLLVYNHTTNRGEFPKGRNMLNVAISQDGKRWTPVITLERQQGEYSYPTVMQSSDGLVHITYTYQRASVKYVVLNPDQIKL